MKIINRRGHPNFTFEIDGKVYFYGFRGAKSDYQMVLQCKNGICGNHFFILPSDLLRPLIQNSPQNSKYAKTLDKLNPKVYDMNNYNINTFDVGRGHTCPGTKLEVYLKNSNPEIFKCKLVKIANHRGFPNYHFEINGKMYFYGFKGIKADYKIVLYCTKKYQKGKTCTHCYNYSSILPTEFLKQIIKDNPS